MVTPDLIKGSNIRHGGERMSYGKKQIFHPCISVQETEKADSKHATQLLFLTLFLHSKSSLPESPDITRSMLWEVHS